MRVLLVEDHEKLGALLPQILAKQGIEADWARDAEEAYAFLEYNRERAYDVVVLDWMLPGMSGPEICATLRGAEKYRFGGGILFLTARDSLDDKIVGLEAGGDDYLVKPFENAELVARLRALYRRKSRPYIDSTYRVADLVVNRTERTVARCGARDGVPAAQEVRFGAREFEILDLLLQNVGTVLPRQTIADHVWGEMSDLTAANLDSHIYQLRRKIASLGAALRIVLVRGVGYRILETGERKGRKGQAGR